MTNEPTEFEHKGRKVKLVSIGLGWVIYIDDKKQDGFYRKTHAANIARHLIDFPPKPQVEGVWERLDRRIKR